MKGPVAVSHLSPNGHFPEFMMPPVVVSHCLSLVAAFAVAYAATWFARWLAPRLGMLDRPDGRRKLHRRDTPLLGGVSIPAGIGATLILTVILSGGSTVWPALSPAMAALFTSACLVCAVGVLDDYRPLRARLKFALQIAAAAPFVVMYGPAESISLGGLALPLGLAGYGFVAVWVVGCVNAFNLLDGSDGLAGLTGVQAFAGVACLSWIAGDVPVCCFALLCAAAVAGFTVHNLPPARIFLGDAGSMTLGMLAGGLTLLAASHDGRLTMTVPAALLALPLLDTSLAMLRRKLTGRGIGAPDRMHIHHRMHDRGWGARKILAVTGCLNLCLIVASVSGVLLSTDIVPVAAAMAIFATLYILNVGARYESRLLLARASSYIIRLRKKRSRVPQRDVLPFPPQRTASSHTSSLKPVRKAG